MARKEEWHLVCITRKGKVSILRNLDLRTARETYKRLLPGTHPEDHQFCEQCSKKNGGIRSWSGGGWCSSSDSDRLERVEAVGPEGVKLDPWHGVKPRVIFHCRVGEPIWNNRGDVIGYVPPHPKPELKWEEGRSDFWNNPKLWDGIDPTKQMCWQRKPDELLHNDGAGSGGAEHHQRGASDLRGNKRPQGVSPQSRNHAAPRTPRRKSGRLTAGSLARGIAR